MDTMAEEVPQEVMDFMEGPRGLALQVELLGLHGE